MYMLRTDSWYLERVVYLAAGIVVLIGIIMSAAVSPYWMLLSAFAGVNLIIFAFTGFCLMANMLRKFIKLTPKLGR